MSDSEDVAFGAYGYEEAPDDPPLIGISPCLGRSMVLVGDDRLPSYDFYIRAIHLAGGVPVILPDADPGDARVAIENVDGLLLTGGGDIDPSAYGAAKVAELQGVRPHRDRIEFALVSHALERGIPVLGVCRGAQLLNVALGGTLNQDIEGHRDEARWAQTVHDVRVEAGSRLQRLLNSDHVGVNSMHHQAISKLAPSLAVSARAADGVIEAFEGRGGSALLGVQWHPEMLSSFHSTQIFGWLCNQSAEHRLKAGNPKKDQHKRGSRREMGCTP